VLEVWYLNTEEQQHWLFLNNYRGAAALEVCYSYKCDFLLVCNSYTEEQQRRKCVILIQRSSSAERVLFLYRGAAALKVCYSNTELQHYC